MPNRSSGLSRSASRWTFQVSASLGASLIAALIVQALPRAAPEAPLPAPELTSGGKFAARIMPVRAYDGLDTMPLPRVDPSVVDQPPVVGAAVLTTPSTDPAGFGAALRQSAADGAGAPERAKPSRSVRVLSRVEARRTRAPADAPAPTDARDAVPPAPTVAESSDGGLLHQVVTKTSQVWSGTSATTQEAWSATASVGSSLVSRLIP